MDLKTTHYENNNDPDTATMMIPIDPNSARRPVAPSCAAISPSAGDSLAIGLALLVLLGVALFVAVATTSGSINTFSIIWLQLIILKDIQRSRA